MKISNKKIAITSIIAALPIIFGIIMYDKIPPMVAIHWGIKGEANGWALREIFVFLFPLGMALLQTLSCIISNLKYEEKSAPKFVKFAIWIIPAVSLILYPITVMLAVLGI